MPSHGARILVNSCFYRPDLVGTGVYAAEMCEWLAQRGHRVSVVCAPPFYPKWEVEPPYSQWEFRRERLSQVDLIRCPLWVPRQCHGWRRIVHSTSFLLASIPAMVYEALRKPNLVIIVAPSILNAVPSLLVAKTTGARAWIHFQDFELDIAFSLGQLRSARLLSWFKALESWILRRFDVVSTISPRMMDRLAEKGVPQEQRLLFPNWVDTGTIYPMEKTSSYRPQLGIAPEDVVALYSGSMGRKHGIESLIAAAKLLVGKAHIQFLVCGDGVTSAHLKELAAGLPNVRFLPLQPHERFNDLLNAADMHLLPQRSSIADLVMPSKLLGMFSSGRPVVATAEEGTQVGQVVSGRGLLVPPEHPEKLADAVLTLAENPALREQLGRNARQYAVQNYRREIILGTFASYLIPLLSSTNENAVHSAKSSKTSAF